MKVFDNPELACRRFEQLSLEFQYPWSLLKVRINEIHSVLPGFPGLKDNK